MKSFQRICAFFGAGLMVCSSTFAQSADPVEGMFREAYNSYKAGKIEASTQTLRQIIQVFENHASAQAASTQVDNALLPPELGEWKASGPTVGDSTAAGTALTRAYRKNMESITVKVVKDSQMLKGMLALMDNSVVLFASGAETQKIGRETAIIEGGERQAAPRLRMGIDGRIYVELTGSEKVRRDQVALGAGSRSAGCPFAPV